MLRLATFAVSLVLGAGLALTAWPKAEAEASAQAAGAIPVCPDRFTGQASLVCGCSAEAAASGSVWGSDLYTDDSAVCRAAVHAGVIPARGGAIWVFERPGQSSYPAADRNGVSSGTWGSWQRSIAFRPASDAPADAKPWAEACPANAQGLDVGAALTCSCSIEAIASGSVWGSGPYTADSAICRAAIHAGAISDSGGEVTLSVSAGRDGYAASERNGVAAGQWGSYPKSFAFE